MKKRIYLLIAAIMLLSFNSFAQVFKHNTRVKITTVNELLSIDPNTKLMVLDPSTDEVKYITAGDLLALVSAGNIYTQDGEIPANTDREMSFGSNSSLNIVNGTSEFFLYSAGMSFDGDDWALSSTDGGNSINGGNGSALSIYGRNLGIALRTGTSGVPDPVTVGQVWTATDANGGGKYQTITPSSNNLQSVLDTGNTALNQSITFTESGGEFDVVLNEEVIRFEDDDNTESSALSAGLLALSDNEDIFSGNRLELSAGSISYSETSNSSYFNLQFRDIMNSTPSTNVNVTFQPLTGTVALTSDVNGLQALNEGNGIGWRFIGKDAAKYGNIGLGAADFSDSFSASTTMGGTGSYTLTSGQDVTNAAWGGLNHGYANIITSAATLSGTIGTGNTISSSYSYGIGTNLTLSGAQSGFFGDNSTLSGNFTKGMGYNLFGRSFGEQVFGAYNTDYTPSSTNSWNASDRLFVIGNGQTGARSDALIIKKNGEITAPSLSVSDVNSAGGNAIPTVDWHNANSVTSSNGLTKTSNNIELGGDLTKQTLIDPSSNDYHVGDWSSEEGSVQLGKGFTMLANGVDYKLENTANAILKLDTNFAHLGTFINGGGGFISFNGAQNATKTSIYGATGIDFTSNYFTDGGYRFQSILNSAWGELDFRALSQDRTISFQNKDYTVAGLDDLLELQHSYGSFGFEGNSTASTISSANTYVKVLGSTTEASTSSDVTHSSGRLTYTGTATKHFVITANFSVNVPANNQIVDFKIAVNGTPVGFASRRKINSSTDIGAQTVGFDINLSTGDFVELYTENETSTNNITVEELYFRMQSI